MWAEVDPALSFPDLSPGADPFAFLDDLKMDSAPAPDHAEVSPSFDTMLDELMQSFQPSAPSHGAHECIVCYEYKDSATQHNHYSRCGHGHMLCNNCADKVHRCPLCREIKEGYETFVMATEALENANEPPCGHEHEHTPSCSGQTTEAQPVQHPPQRPSTGTGLPAELDAELDAFLDATRPVVPEGGHPDVVEQGLPAPAPDADWTAALTFGQPPAHPPANMVLDGPATPDGLPSEDEVPALGGQQHRRGRGRTSATRRRDRPTEAAPAPVQPHQRSSTHVSPDKDNPFASVGVPDEQVEMLPFKEFQALMKRHNFGAAQMATAKKFRKRLKNRRQVMLYADKKRVTTASLRSTNIQLAEKMRELQEENDELKDRNHFLEQTLQYLEQERDDALHECSALQEQMNELTSQMNALGFFDGQMINLE